MRILRTVLACAAFVTCAAGANADDAGASMSLPVGKLKFFETGVGPLQAAAAFGNLKSGPHGTLIKMPAGWVSPAHTHTDDYWAVVVSGVGANGVPGSADIELPAGSYWYQKGKEAHVTKCVSATECSFFVSQTGPFDYVPAK